MATKKKRKKKRRSQSGGSISGMRSGIKGLVGQGPKKKESTFSRVLTWVLLAAAAGLVAYRFFFSKMDQGAP